MYEKAHLISDFRKKYLLGWGSNPRKWDKTWRNLWSWEHCNPLQGNYRVELLHSEIPAVITGNDFTDYRVLQQPFKPCGMNCQFPVHITWTRTTISTLLKQGKKCNQNRRKLYSLQDRYRVELLHREIPVISTGNGFAM